MCTDQLVCIATPMRHWEASALKESKTGLHTKNIFKKYFLKICLPCNITQSRFNHIFRLSVKCSTFFKTLFKAILRKNGSLVATSLKEVDTLDKSQHLSPTSLCYVCVVSISTPSFTWKMEWMYPLDKKGKSSLFFFLSAAADLSQCSSLARKGPFGCPFLEKTI